MIRAIAPIAALLLGVAILLTGQGLQGVLLPVRAAMEQFSSVAIGMFGAAYFLGFALGCLRGARLVQRVGHVRVFAAMTALASATPLLHGLWINLGTWIVLRFLTGFCFAALYVVIESWLNETATNANRGSVFSAYVLINMTMLGAGQQMMLLDTPTVMTLFAVSSVLVSLAALPVVLSTTPSPRETQDVRPDVPRLYRTSPAGMLGSLATGTVNGSFWALGPLFAITVSEDVAHYIAVETGYRPAAGLIVATNGVSSGDTVVVGSFQKLSDGAAVQVRRVLVATDSVIPDQR